MPILISYLKKLGSIQNCHSERSEESLDSFWNTSRDLFESEPEGFGRELSRIGSSLRVEDLRFTQDDREHVKIPNVKKNAVLLTILLFLIGLLIYQQFIWKEKPTNVLSVQTKQSYWLELKRRSNIETLYFGEPGNKEKSEVVKTFRVKTGIPGERPTPLPKLLGRDYWIITDKAETLDNEETAPYFLTLDIPVSEEEPYGPIPYEECGDQCNWIIPGAFGLHGVAGDETKLSENNPGSSGCIRHSDIDITYLYSLLELEKEEIRYYIVEH